MPSRRWSDGDELLPPREDQLHRAAGDPCERRNVRFEVEVALGAESSSEQRHDDPDVRLGHLQRVRDPDRAM